MLRDAASPGLDFTSWHRDCGLSPDASGLSLTRGIGDCELWVGIWYLEFEGLSGERKNFRCQKPRFQRVKNKVANTSKISV